MGSSSEGRICSWARFRQSIINCGNPINRMDVSSPICTNSTPPTFKYRWFLFLKSISFLSSAIWIKRSTSRCHALVPDLARRSNRIWGRGLILPYIIFEYCRNKCHIIISVKEGPPFCQLTLSFNMTCMPFQHYHLQNIIRVHLHK